MARYIRNSVVLAKVEATYGADVVPTPAANALLVSNLSIKYNYNNVDRALVRPFFGGAEQLAGTRNIEIDFDVEIAGSGAAATPTAWGPLLQACGMTQTIGASWVAYDPNTDGAATKSVSIYFYDDGVLHKALGCRGTVEFKMGAGERPLMSYKFTGIDGGATAATPSASTLTAWKAPVTMTDTNAGDVMLGAVTWSAGALSGGTTFPSKGLSLNLGNSVNHSTLLGGESVDITNREVTGAISIDLDAAGEVAAMTEVNANTLTALGFQFGTTTGYKVQLYGPKVQRINPKKEEQDGRRLIGFDLRFTPNAGNDELKIVTL
jgi:uncharacterized protein YuzE